MKIVFKIILFLFLIIILTLGVAVVTSNLWLGRAIAAAIHQVTDLPVTVQKAYVSLPNSEFWIYGIKIKNPDGFSDGVLALIPELFVDFDFSQFFAGGKLHFRIIRLSLEEFSIIRNEQGVTNLGYLKTVEKDNHATAAQPEVSAPAVKRRFLIDQLVLTIRNVKYTDRSLPIPVHKTVDLKIDQEVFRGVTNLGDIIRIILMKIFYNASFATLGVPADLLKQQFGPSLLRGQEVLVQSTELARVMGTQVLGEGRKFVEEATSKIPATVPIPQEVNQITEEVKGKATGLFKNAARFLKSTTDTLTEKVGDKSNSSKTQS